MVNELRLGFSNAPVYFADSVVPDHFADQGGFDIAFPNIGSALKAQKLSPAQGYPGNNFNEFWATGIEAYVFGSGRGRDSLLEADPRLYELVRQVIPATKMPGNVYVGHTRATLPPK